MTIPHIAADEKIFQYMNGLKNIILIESEKVEPQKFHVSLKIADKIGRVLSHSGYVNGHQGVFLSIVPVTMEIGHIFQRINGQINVPKYSYQ